MTPEAIDIVSRLRNEFYALFAGSIQIPVNITKGNASMGNPPIVSWIDDGQKLNYLHIYAHSAPDELIPQRPFIMRVTINKGAGIGTGAKYGKSYKGVNQSWKFELTLLPEEIIDFLPWIVDLIKSNAKGAKVLQEPPHPFYRKTTNVPADRDVWTEKAWQFARPRIPHSINVEAVR